MGLEAIESCSIADQDWGQFRDYESSWNGRTIHSPKTSKKFRDIASPKLEGLSQPDKTVSILDRDISQLHLDESEDDAEFFDLSLFTLPHQLFLPTDSAIPQSHLFGSRRVYEISIRHGRVVINDGNNRFDVFICQKHKKKKGFWHKRKDDCKKVAKKVVHAVKEVAKDVGKAVEKAAHEVKEFVVEHKTEIIVVAAVVVAVAVTAGVFAAAGAGAAGAAAGAAGEKEEDHDHHPVVPEPVSNVSLESTGHLPPEGVPATTPPFESLPPSAQTSFGRQVLNWIAPASIALPPDSIEPALSWVAHQAWNQSMAGKSEFNRLASFCDSLCDTIGLSTPNVSKEREQEWKEKFSEGHEQIDKFFGTSFAQSYDPETHIKEPAEWLSAFIVPQEALTGRVSNPELLGAQLGRITALAERELIGQGVVKLREHGLNFENLCRAGQELDREGLTIGGRSLDKHGNRPDSPFPKATGNTEAKNLQGQQQLESILKDPNLEIINDKDIGFKIYAQDGRGVYFYKDGTFRGFIERQYE